MAVGLQDVAALAVVALAGLFLARKAFRVVAAARPGGASGGCGTGCGGCGSAKGPGPVVEINGLKPPGRA